MLSLKPSISFKSCNTKSLLRLNSSTIYCILLLGAFKAAIEARCAMALVPLVTCPCTLAQALEIHSGAPI